MTQTTTEHPAITALRDNQRQLDADGCEVGVSRQAADEVLALLDAFRTAASAGMHALRSYQYGNGSPDLAASVADELDRCLRVGAGVAA